MSATLATLYRAIRRLHVMDVTCLLHTSPAQAAEAADQPRVRPASDGLIARVIEFEELEPLRRDGRICPVVGTGIARTAASGEHGPGDQWLFGIWDADRVISFIWAATGYIPASENFSRSAHLGSSLNMPPHCGFLFNAWTDPEHRGRGLMANLLRSLIHEDALGLNLQDWFATTDWTNVASQSTFHKCGFQRVGRLYRVGRGRMQASVVPDLERRMKETVQLEANRQKPHIAADAPGLRWSL
ncbi:GNAT family N-acetyltransferase [Rhodopirellula sp. P2]|uniref:GNAT family N-acetyltransferase n=1 Tax=Rhodopirellula sp. P2 TaxID=2127060 RepID=UPI002368CD0B|nr:GNAT family N-acetyltransferase [Rhodopirellula sp. P2]WDQ17316.1 GNAT family N-acetyltransferase [Rhodopirellula sp. P2]